MSALNPPLFRAGTRRVENFGDVDCYISDVSLRDLFAAFALPSFLATAYSGTTDEQLVTAIAASARGAYLVADAMLVERTKDKS